MTLEPLIEKAAEQAQEHLEQEYPNTEPFRVVVTVEAYGDDGGGGIVWGTAGRLMDRLSLSEVVGLMRIAMMTVEETVRMYTSVPTMPGQGEHD